MHRLIQRASLRLRNLPSLARRLRSMRAMLCPVSMAVELATARRMAALAGALARAELEVFRVGFIVQIILGRAVACLFSSRCEALRLYNIL